MDNQRPILYLALVFLGFLIWQAWHEDYGPKPPKTVSIEAPGTEPGDIVSAEDIPTGPTGTDAPDTPAAGVAARALAPTAGRVQVRTDVLNVEIDLRDFA